MRLMLERWFRLRENGTTARIELGAGLTTFLTLSYILFVQPALLAGEPSRMDLGAVTAATCISSALATLLMGLWARYPVALAPGMGINAYFVYTLIPAAAALGHPEPWRAGLAVVFVAGVVFVALTALGVRERLMESLSPSLKHAIAVGIGLLIAFIGLRNAGLVVAHPATLVALRPDLLTADVAVAATGFGVAAALHVRGLNAALLLGIAASATLAALLGKIHATGVVAAPPSLGPTFLAMDLRSVLEPGILQFVPVFLFVAMFDAMGTLVGVAEQAGMTRDGRLPRAGRALGTDALATMLGASLGTSTVTCYIESAAGVAAGGRTGLVCVVVAALFLLALLFAPLITALGAYAPITAPALLLVGAIMLQSVQHIDWSDPTEWIPAFFILVGIPLTFSIGDGMALGFLAYPILKLSTGRAKDVPMAMWLLSAAVGIYFALLRI